MIVRKTTPEEARRVNELFAICFEQPYCNCPIDPDHDDAAHWAAYDEDGAMMSNFTISDYDIRFDGNVCKMGGIGGVATLPQYRRRGGIRACFREALPDMYAQGYDFSYLYPFSTAYYRKFGYECCVQKYAWEVDLAQLNPPKTGGSFVLMEKHRPMTEAVRALDGIWERRYNMMVCHGEEDYRWTTEVDPAGKLDFTYVCFDAAGKPSAYATFRTVSEPSGRNLHCSRFCFKDKGGFYGLMELFKSMAADHAKVLFNTPVNPAFQYLLSEWSLGAAKWSLHASAGMVRVVNVKRILEKAAYHGSGKFTLAIQDPQIPENDRTFVVTFQDGRATAVEETAHEPDAVMAISTFSALISGVCGFAEAKETFSGLEIKRDNPAFHQVFYRKPLYICDYF